MQAKEGVRCKLDIASITICETASQGGADILRIDNNLDKLQDLGSEGISKWVLVV